MQELDGKALLLLTAWEEEHGSFFASCEECERAEGRVCK